LNLFFEAESFAAILIAHRTQELSEECVLWVLLRPGRQKFEAESREGVIGSFQPATGSRGAL